MVGCMPSDPTDVVAAYFECVNGEDWERLAGLWAENGTMRAVGTRRRDGREDVLEYYRGIFREWPEHDDRPTRVIVANSTTATVELQFRGVTHDGRTVEFDAVDLFDIEDGRIVRLSTWYDIAYVRDQLSGAA